MTLPFPSSGAYSCTSTKDDETNSHLYRYAPIDVYIFESIPKPTGMSAVRGSMQLIALS
jgi:hypothetical protein